MPTSARIKADQSQLDALDSGCGIVRWGSASIIGHRGPDALDLLHRLTTKELLSITTGQTQRTVLTSNKGRVTDVMLVANVGENDLLLISDAKTAEKTIADIDFYTIIEDAELTDLSSTHSRISLIGPGATATAKAALGVSVNPGNVVSVEQDGATITLASDTSRGVEWIDIVCENTSAHAVTSALTEADTSTIDEAHFELFRIKHAIPGTGQEYGDHANPIESGLLGLIDFDKGCYVGQEVIARLNAYDKVQRNLRLLSSKSPLSAGTKLQSNDKPAGLVTSASQLESDDVYLSLALVRKDYLEQGTELVADGVPASVKERHQAASARRTATANRELAFRHRRP